MNDSWHPCSALEDVAMCIGALLIPVLFWSLI